MSRIDDMFARVRAEGRVALMPFLTVGYPDFETSIELMQAMVEAGADGLEIGIPFSDPLAEGPTIQRSSFHALQQGITPAHAIEAVRRLRQSGVAVPLMLMGYCNNFLARGEDFVISAAADAGADGLIIPDLPPEESDSALALCRKHGLNLVFLAAPTSDESRVTAILERASGFIYVVGVVGVTGARAHIESGLPEYLRMLRSRTDLPLVVGFGISKREHVAALSGLADAAIVGSAVIDLIESSPRDERVERVRKYVEVLTGRAEANA